MMIVPEKNKIDFFILCFCSSFYPKNPYYEDGYISPTMAMIEATLHGRFINLNVTTVVRD
jgi:hypothetical protein